MASRRGLVLRKLSTVDGRGREVRARGRLESCRACHRAVAGTDFVARNYLPADLRRKLK